MKKTFTLLLTLVLILNLGTFTAFAASPTHRLSARYNDHRSCCGTLRDCVRNHHDYCFSPCAIDADGDGICDSRSTLPCNNQGNHYCSAQSSHHSRGHHGRRR